VSAGGGRAAINQIDLVVSNRADAPWQFWQ
jgi:hypothetical protein